MKIIRGPKSKLEERCRQRGTTIDAVRQCITLDEGEYVTVDVDHPAYPRPIQPAGLGDFVETVAKLVGADKAAKLYERLSGRSCGCQARKAWLNRAWRAARKRLAGQ